MKNFNFRAWFYPENGGSKLVRNIVLIYQYTPRHFSFNTLVICVYILLNDTQYLSMYGLQYFYFEKQIWKGKARRDFGPFERPTIPIYLGSKRNNPQKSSVRLISVSDLGMN